MRNPSLMLLFDTRDTSILLFQIIGKIFLLVTGLVEPIKLNITVLVTNNQGGNKLVTNNLTESGSNHKLNTV